MSAPATRIYRGWPVLAGSFTCAMLVIGSTIYLFSLLVIPVSKEFGLSRADVTNGMIALLLGSAMWSPLVGRLVDRVSTRAVMMAGGVFMAAGAVAIASAESPRLILLFCFLLLGLGMPCAGSLAAQTVVARWFRRRRGRAMGFMAVATSTGGFLVPPVGALLIGAYGWRTALMIMGPAIGAIIVLLALLVIRNNPGEGEMAAAGELAAAPSDKAPFVAEERAWTLSEILREPNFWLILLGAALLMASDQALIAAKIPYLLEKGVSLQAASMLLAVQSGSAVLGKLAVGFLSERIDIRRLFGGIAAFHAVMLICYIVWPGYWAMLAIMAVIGVALGGVVPVWLTLTASAFGARSFGQAAGAMALGMQIMSVISLRFSSTVFDRTGSYVPAFWTFVGCAGLSWLLISAVRMEQDPPRRRRWFRTRSAVAPAAE